LGKLVSGFGTAKPVTEEANFILRDGLELSRTLDMVYILMTSCLVTANNTYFLNSEYELRYSSFSVTYEIVV
jgi:hypothetical protein